jgi:adenosine deaminase CECR1
MLKTYFKLIFILIILYFFYTLLIPVNYNNVNHLYLREKLIQETFANSFSNNIVLNEAEIELDHYLKSLSYNFRSNFLKSNHQGPARNFLEVKSQIETSPLMKILKKMPKGGLLHIHADSTGDAVWLIKRAIHEKNCYIYWSDDGYYLKGKMSIFLNKEVPPGFFPMHELSFKDETFVSKVANLITMQSEDSESENPWEKFNICFQRIEDLFYYKPIFFDYYVHAFNTIAEDKISHVELRTSLDNLYDAAGKTITGSEVVEVFRSICKQVQQTHPKFTLKIIISDQRSYNMQDEYVLLERAYKLRSENSDMVTGYDLVGFETDGHPILYYLENLKNAAKFFSHKYQVNLPYFFHAGESGWEDDKNIFDAVLLDTKRIGHALNLFYFPTLINELKQKKICIEVCLISNQVLGYIKDLRLHPAISYMKQGIPCVLSSDDPLIYKNSGLSYDFWEAIMAWNLSLKDVKQLCINSILYSSMNDEEKSKALESWTVEWELFVAQIINELQYHANS